MRELQALVRRVEMLQEMTQQEMTQQEMSRQQSGIASPAVLASIEATLTILRAEIAQLQRRIQEQAERSAELSKQRRLLCSIPGVGRWTAARVLAEIDAMCGAVDARQLAAHAGLTPRERTSGTSVHRPPRLAKTGKGPPAEMAICNALATPRLHGEAADDMSNMRAWLPASAPAQLHQVRPGGRWRAVWRRC